MAMNPIKRKTMNSFILGVIITLIITGAIIAYLFLQLSGEKKKQSIEQAASKNVYVLNKDIPAGTEVTTSDFTKLSVRSTSASLDGAGKPSKKYFSSVPSDIAEPKDGYAKIQLTKGSILTSDMIGDSPNVSDNGVRIQEYNMISLLSNLQKDSFVDIRLRLASGADVIVVSKKQVVDTNGNSIWLKMSEAETLLMSSAIVESYIVTGSKLYAVVYSDAGLSKELQITYSPSRNVASAIMDNPNVVNEAKSALSARIANIDKYRPIIDNDLKTYEITKTTSVDSRTKEEVSKQQAAREAYLQELNGTTK